jgi:metal-responsive CopG/Arc/MetJ family transcriptional regulator
VERIIVTLPRELLDELDATAKSLKCKRSRLIRDALGEWLEQQRKAQFESLLEEGYRAQANEIEQLARDLDGLQAEATRSAWRWDEQ